MSLLARQIVDKETGHGLFENHDLTIAIKL